MSNLLKSKFLLGVMTVAIMFVGAVAVNATTAAASCSITTTLKVGSTGAEVVCLQTALGGLTADGNFGAKTKAAVIKFQTNANLTADGVFGAMSRNAWLGNQGNAGNFPSGCTSAAGFSTSTGLSCAGSGGSNLPAGCSTSSGFSPTTGMSCSVLSTLPAGCSTSSGFSPTTGASCSGAGSTVVTNGAGSLSLAGTTADVETQAPEGVVTKVLGIKAQASGSDISVGYVNVSLENRSTFTTDSTRLDHYASEVSVYVGSTKVGSALVSDFTKNGAIYTATIPISGAVVKVGSINKVNFYVAVTPVTNIDTGDATGTGVTASDNFWYVTAGGFRFTDGTGLTLSGTDPVTNASFSFAKIVNSGDLTLKVVQSSSPVAGNVSVSDTNSTSGILLNSFTMKPTGADMTMTSLTVNLTGTGSGTGLGLSGIAQNLTLTANGVQVAEIDSVLPATSAVAVGPTANTFNLDNDLIMKAGSTVNFQVFAKINKVGTATFAQGDTLLASYSSAAVEATNGGASLSTLISGSSVGNAQKFYSQGINAANLSATITSTAGTTSGSVTQQEYKIGFDVTAFGNTYYIPKSLKSSALSLHEALNGLSYSLVGSAGTITEGTTTVTSSASPLASSDATTVSSYFEVPDGATRHFTVTVDVVPGSGTRNPLHDFVGVQLGQLRYDLNQTYSDTTATTTDALYTLSPATNFLTAQVGI